MTSTPQAPATINRLVWRTVRRIPCGRVSTYGEIADLAGLGRGARRVGRALRELPHGSDVPWHRVLRAGGQIAFARQSDTFDKQCRRLEAEGVELRRGRVDMTRFGWRRTLDEMLWKPDES